MCFSGKEVADIMKTVLETGMVRGRRLFVTFPSLWEEWRVDELESALMEHFTSKYLFSLLCW